MERPFERIVGEKIRASFGAGAGLRSIVPLAGDASSRRYYRALLLGSGAPSSLIVMELAGSSLPLSSEELAVFKEPPRELPFLEMHRFLEQVGVRIPLLYGHWVDEKILFLEDLGDTALWDLVQTIPASAALNWYEKALEQLLLIQMRGTRLGNPSCIAFQQRFDYRLYMWEFDHFIEYGLEQGGRTKINEQVKKALKATFDQIAARLDRQRPCLNHRDYHSWNLMAHDGELVVIDFQDALLAPAQYDLASLLNDRETDRVITSAMESHLLDYYLRRRDEIGEGRADRDEFFEVYLLSALQRDFKVVGRFHYLDLVKGKPGYKRYLLPTVRRIKRNLKRLPALEKLIPLLAPYFEEMR